MTPVLDARDLVRIYQGRQGLFARPTPIRAVDGVSLAVHPGETLGIVGESGSGKSTLGRMLLGVDPAQEGEVRFNGCPLPAPKTPDAREMRDGDAPQHSGADCDNCCAQWCLAILSIKQQFPAA